jgi:hypothetical protein
MSTYSTDELKAAWRLLLRSSCKALWKDVNIELMQRLGLEKYTIFAKGNLQCQ